MGKAIWIRRKLVKSLSPKVRDYYSLIADPAAGTVTVVARTPRLAFPGLWTYVPAETQDAPQHKPQHRARVSWKQSWEALCFLYRMPAKAIQDLDLGMHERFVNVERF